MMIMMMIYLYMVLLKSISEVAYVIQTFCLHYPNQLLVAHPNPYPTSSKAIAYISQCYCLCHPKPLPMYKVTTYFMQCHCVHYSKPVLP